MRRQLYTTYVYVCNIVMSIRLPTQHDTVNSSYRSLTPLYGVIPATKKVYFNKVPRNISYSHNAVIIYLQFVTTTESFTIVVVITVKSESYIL